MPIFRYENLSHVELAQLPRDKTVVFLSTGPLEQHGPHLPLGTDAITASFLSDRVAERLSASRSDWNFLVLPTVFAGSDTLAYSGTIEVRPSILRGLLMDNCKHLAKTGFKNIVLFGTHSGARHMVVLEEVASKISWRYRARAVSASARYLCEVWQGKHIKKIIEQMERAGTPLTAEECEGLKKDFHSGLIETSLMMIARPDLVNPMYKTLKPAIVKSMWGVRRHVGKKAGAGLGHLGSPALARPEIGRAALEAYLSDLVPALEKFLDGKKMSRYFRSKLYFIPFFRTDFLTVTLLILYPILILIGWLVIKSTFFPGM